MLSQLQDPPKTIAKPEHNMCLEINKTHQDEPDTKTARRESATPLEPQPASIAMS